MAISARASQDFVPIKEIRDGVVVLKDGGLRAVLMASSINFALKSEDNQQAIIGQFQSFLNSLDFSVQIVIESRRFDIRPYLATLEERYQKQDNELLKIQTREYIGFVKKFAEGTNIMNKAFFLVVPYSPAILEMSGQKEGIAAKLGFGHRGTSEADKKAGFDEHKAQLDQRVAVVEQGLIRTGVRVVALGTEEIVELYYKLFNPGETEKSVQTS